MPTFHPDSLHSFVVQVCEAMGSLSPEANLVADQLIGANLAGHDSHGVGMLPAYVMMKNFGSLQINQHVSTVIDTGSVVVLDGNSGFGQVNGKEAMDIAIERARANGVALVGLRNSFHIGRIGHWAEQCVAAGLASVHFVNVAGHSALVAPYGGADARFATNPFCVAVPAVDGKPAALLDMATSKIAMGKARVAKNKGVPVPPETLIDGQGRVTDDPSGMFEEPRQGALIAMGDHKGSGLAIMCELVGAALIGGPTLRGQDRPPTIINNMLTIAIDPAALGAADGLATEFDAYLDWVRASPVREGFDEVLMPGEPEQRSRIARAEGVEVDDTTHQELVEAAGAAGRPDLSL
ncbi:MAG: malate/lactate/ureidoglycolate dehydrogenase [Actinomycetia bacterium]|nr:malate/lactate/ureidoglycolate dehydrogenase [Actinomycetes bacterium]